MDATRSGPFASMRRKGGGPARLRRNEMGAGPARNSYNWRAELPGEDTFHQGAKRVGRG
jgi:hypothetical protein